MLEVTDELCTWNAGRYRVGDDVIRHAQVGVVEPASGEPAADADESADTDD